MTFALITGGSGGIGLAIAQELAKKNYNILLVARSDDKLRDSCEKLAKDFGVQAYYLALDLSRQHADKEVIAWVKKNNWPLSILVNNAGYGVWGALAAVPYERTQDMIQLNVNTLVGLCIQAIPLLKQAPQAYILNLGSTAAYQAVPYLISYAASKAFVVSFSRGLRWELKESNISVSCLSPGVTDTNFAKRADMQDIFESASKITVVMTPEKVAKIALKGLFSKKAEIIPGGMNIFSVVLVWLFPKFVAEKVAKILYTKKNNTKTH